MCQYMSWLEHDGKILFLTDADLATEKGQALKAYLGSQYQEDIKGHGAIRHYFFGSSDIEKGIARECTDFSSTKNFPPQIVEALKAGQMTYAPIPEGLLCDTLYADYKAKRAALYADYEAKCAALYADYKAKCAALYADYKAKCAPLYADYKAKRAPLYADYKAKCAPLYADYKAKCAPLYADYEAKRDTLDDEQWMLFLDPKNRTAAWR
jgi:hypothetical protein